MKELIWSDFYEVGLDLSKNRDEAYLRSAIGRYYYAIFGMAKLYLTNTMDERVYNTRKNIHKKLINRLLYSNDENESHIGEVLENLRKKRNYADYDLNKTTVFNSITLKNIELLTKKSLETLDYLIKNPPIHYTNKNH